MFWNTLCISGFWWRHCHSSSSFLDRAGNVLLPWKRKTLCQEDGKAAAVISGLQPMKIRSVNLSVGVFPYLKGSLSCNFWQARVRLAAGEWSNKFSLDAAGSGGDLKVKKGGKLHEVTEECQQVLIFSMKSVHTSVTFLKRCFNFTFFLSRSVRRLLYLTSVWPRSWSLHPST